MEKTEYYKMPSSAVSILKEKKVLVILPPNFNDEEFNYLSNYFKIAKLDVKIASIGSSAVGAKGTSIKPNIRLSDASADDFDAVIILSDASGTSSQELSENKDILELVKKADKKKKIIAATGMASRIIAAAGILKGKMLTFWRDPDLLKFIKDKGGSYVWEPVVWDGNLITADSPSSVRMFVDTLIDALTR